MTGTAPRGGSRWRSSWRRLPAVASSSINTLLLPALSPLVSILVVRLASVELWGAFVPALVVVQLAAHVIGWGNRDALLRDFSRDPAGIARAWQSSLFTRSLLLIPVLAALALAGTSPARTALLAAWTAAMVLQQSHDVLVVYRRAFAFATAVELGGLAVTAAAVALAPRALSVDTLIALFAAVAAAKAGVLLVRFSRTTLRASGARLEPAFLRRALPFFLLGLSGLLESRADLYCVSVFRPGGDVGRYQVLVGLVVLLESVPAVVLQPFLRGLYRLGGGALVALVPRFALLAPAVVLPGMAAVGLALHYLYRVSVPTSFLVAGGLAALPAFAYLPVVYALYQSGRQASVLYVNVVGVVVNLALTVLLLPRLGLLGALAAAAAAQWVMLLAYLIRARRLAAAPRAAAEATISLQGAPPLA